MKVPRTHFLAAGVATAALLAGQQALAQGGPLNPGDPLEGMLPGYEGTPSDSWNSELVGWSTLQARSTYNGMVIRQGDRYILYAGHHSGEHFNPMTGEIEENGFSIVDVTDPANPVFLKHMPGLYRNNARNLAACGGDELPGGTAGEYYLVSEQGSGHVLFDITDPANPVFMYDIEGHGGYMVGDDPDGGFGDVHKTSWHCPTGVAALTSTWPGWHNRLTSFYDLSDPSAAEFMFVYSLPQAQPNASDPDNYRQTEPHEALLVEKPEEYKTGGDYGDYWALISYGTGSDGVWQLIDVETAVNAVADGSYNPDEPTDEQLRIPLVSEVYFPHWWGVHTAIPLFDYGDPPGWDNRADAPGVRHYMAAISEETGNDCSGHSHDLMIMYDITDLEHPVGISNYYSARFDAERTGLSEQEIMDHHCDIGGRYDTHASGWNFNDPYYKKLLWIAAFNAGARAVDIRNPYNLQEVAYYIPETNEEGGLRNGKKVIQTNNLNTDDRGYVYLFDRAGNGLHIILPTGPAREIADFPAAPPS